MLKRSPGPMTYSDVCCAASVARSAAVVSDGGGAAQPPKHSHAAPPSRVSHSIFGRVEGVERTRVWASAVLDLGAFRSAMRLHVAIVPLRVCFLAHDGNNNLLNQGLPV